VAGAVIAVLAQAGGCCPDVRPRAVAVLSRCAAASSGGCCADGHSAHCPIAQQVTQGRDVGIRSYHPAHVGHTLLGSGPPGTRQHVRLRIDADHGAHPPGDRQGQLAGPAAEIHRDVGFGQLERPDQRVDDR
jgi:hypothetical protein